MKRIALAAACLVAATATAHAQTIDLSGIVPQAGGTASGRIVQLVGLLTVLSIAPGLLVMVTSFTRFAIAFSFLRSGLGLQTTPANLILVSLSLFMTFYVMATTFDQAWTGGLQPLLENKLTEGEAYGKITQPFRDFMLGQVRDKDLQLFDDLAKDSIKTTDRATGDEPDERPAEPTDEDLVAPRTPAGGDTTEDTTVPGTDGSLPDDVPLPLGDEHPADPAGAGTHPGAAEAPPTPDVEEPLIPSPGASRKPGRRKRASVPSWDEIMFGGPKQG